NGGTDYDGIFVQGLSVKVADNDEAGVVITQLDVPRVFEGRTAFVEYTIALTRAPEESVRITAFPTPLTERDRRAGGTGVLLNGRADGVTLLFDRSNWATPQKIRIEVDADQLAEGTKTIPILHRIVQGGSPDDGGAYDSLIAPGLTVDVYDDDSAAV